MATSDLIKKLNDFFDLSKKKQAKKQEKLVKIISKLEHKKAKLEHRAIEESKVAENSDEYHDLSEELIVISKLIKKAKKNKISSEEESDLPPV